MTLTQIVKVSQRDSGGTGQSVMGWVCAALVTVLLLGACGRQSEETVETGPRPVRVATVESSAAAPLREFAGRVERSSVSPLAFQVPGRIVEIAVRDGQQVGKGQLIARVDDVPYAGCCTRAATRSANAKRCCTR